MIFEYIKIVLFGFLAILLQYFLFDNIPMGNYIKGFPYLVCLLFIDFDKNKYFQLLFAFFIGFTMDLLHTSFGAHTAACVVLIFAKNKLENFFLNTESISLQGFTFLHENFRGIQFYAIFYSILILLHHLIFFIFDYAKISAVLTILLSSILSTIITLVFSHIIRIYILRKK